MKYFKSIIAIVLCLSVLCLAGCVGTDKPVDQSSQSRVIYGQKFPVELYEDIVIEDCSLYTGLFPEDGSFAEKEGVATLKVTNTGKKDIQLIRINVKTSSKEIVFEITTLKSGSTVTVLEKAGQTLAENEKILSITGNNRVDYDKVISLHDDVLFVQPHSKTINIKNISDKDIESDIYVYYKKKDADGNSFGGITFRTKADGLKAGEIKQLPASNFNPEDSEVLFIDYVQE